MKKIFFTLLVAIIGIGCLLFFPSNVFAQFTLCPPGTVLVGGRCKPMTKCGNGRIDLREECDDGNRINTDSCTNACRKASCGDGYVRTGIEECDDGNRVNTDACRNNCYLPACGDSIVDGSEQCDDGNVVAGDGCNASCQEEQQEEQVECLSWYHMLGRSGSRLEDIVLDASGNSYVVGRNLPAPTAAVAAIWINKYDINGNEIAPFPLFVPGTTYNTGRGIALGSNGFLYLTGVKDGDIWLAKLDPNTTTGTFAWEVTLDMPPPTPSYPSSFFGGFDITVDPDLNIFVVGRRQTSESESSIWIAKFRENSAGTSADLLGEISADRGGVAESIIFDPAERSIYVVGKIPENRLWVNKYSSADLIPLWASPTVTEIPPNSYGGYGIALEGSTLYVAGFFGSVVKINPSDGTLLSGSIAISGRKARAIIVEGDDIFLTGRRPFGGEFIWIGRLNRVTETISWETLHGYPGVDDAGGYDLARFTDGSLFVVGSHSEGELYYIRKFCPADMVSE